MKKNILFSPIHLIYSQDYGNEYNVSYSLFSKITASNKYNYIGVCGSKSIDDKNVIEVWKDYQPRDFNLKDSLYFNLLYTLCTFRQLYLSSQHFDIIHHIKPFNLYKTFNLAIIFNLRKKPVVIGPFAAPYDEPSNNPLLKVVRYLNWLTLRQADKILINNVQTKKEIEDYVGKKNVELFYIGKNAKDFEYKQRSFTKKNINIVVAGYLNSRKNHKFLIKAFAQMIPLSQKNLTLHIVGDGDQRKTLEKLCNKLKIADKVIFHGTVPYQEMQKYYNMCDYFTLTSSQEAFGHVYLEALFNGLPIVTTKTIGADEIVSPAGGIVTTQGDTKKFVEKFLEIIHNPKNSKLMSQKGREYAENTFDWDKALIPRLTKIYDEISQ